MTVLRRWVLALLPAALLGLYAARPELAFLPWVGLVPWILLYAGDRGERVSYVYYGVGAYATWLALHTQFLRFGWYAWIVIGVVCIPWWLPFAPLLRRIHRLAGWPRMLAVGLAWTSTEWIRATFTVSHFDLYGLGYTQARFPLLVQVADVVGSYGLTFVVACGNAWIAGAILEVRARGWKPAARSRPLWTGAVAMIATLGVMAGYGAWRASTVVHEPGPTVALVQPNTPHGQRNMVGVHLEQLLMTARAVPADEVDLIVWPENAILDNFRREGAYLDDLSWMARDKHAWFLVGALGKDPAYPGLTTNGAWLVDPEGEIRGHYAKQILFPWGEYIPGDRFLGRWLPPVQRFHRELTRLGWGFQPTGLPGRRMDVMEFPWKGETLRFAALICVENTYPPVPAAAGKAGAEFFVNITSEGRVGGPVQEQLLRIAMIRAIENRMSYVRVGNTGISAVIDALGLPTAILRGRNGQTINIPGVLITEVPLSHSPRTLYARSGDAFVKVVLAITAVGLVLSFVRRRRRPTPAVLGVAVVLAVLGGCSMPPSLDGDPDRVDGNIERGRERLSQGAAGAAVEPLARACATEEGCRLALPGLLSAYERGKQDDDAVLLFEAIAERYPALADEALSYAAVFRDRSLDLEGAREDYLRSLELRPSARVHGRLGNLLMRMDRREEAVEQFRQGLALDPDDVQLRYVLGRALRTMGRLDESERILNDVVADRPNHGNAWTNLGRIRLARGDVAGAETAFRTAIRVEPGIIEARFMLARLALRRDDLSTVESLIREIQQIEDGLGPGARHD